jgi:replicative DNA helicase
MKHDIREMATFEKPLPVNRDAEQFVLGVILLDSAAIEQALDLDPGDFFSRPNARTFGAMLSIHGRGDTIDPLTVRDELRLAGELEEVGGPAYITSLTDGVPRFSNIENYVRLVRDASRERQLIRFGAAVTARAFDSEQTLDEQLRQAEAELLSIGDGRGGSHWRELAGVAYDVMCEAERRGAAGHESLDFSTGIRDLDYLTLGLERKTMVVIGAAPGQGKTALGLSMTRLMSESKENLQADGRPPVIAWFSMEMSKEQLAERLLASVARVDLRRLRIGALSKDEWRRVQDATNRMAGWRVHFDDRSGLSPRMMRNAVRGLRRDEGRVDVVVVDYLQLGDGEKQKNETREAEVAKISRGLVALAKDYDLTVIALSQLNRELEKRKDKRPNLGDFRDSGQIAQDAYLLIGLYRDDVYNPNTAAQNIAELIILKQRNGPLATVEVVFLSTVMVFEDKWRPGDL